MYWQWLHRDENREHPQAVQLAKCMFGLWFGRIGNRLIDVEYLDSCCCPWRSWSVKIPFDVMRSMSWACHERSCFLLAFSHGFCMSSLRWTWKRYRNTRFSTFSRAFKDNKQTQKHQENMFCLLKYEGTQPTPPEGGCTWKSDPGYPSGWSWCTEVHGTGIRALWLHQVQETMAMTWGVSPTHQQCNNNLFIFMKGPF